MQIFLFFALFIAILAIIFAVQNNDQATVAFFIWDFEGSLALVLLMAMATGALISFLASLPSNIKNRWTIRNLRKKLVDIENNLAPKETSLEPGPEETPPPETTESPSGDPPIQIEESL